MRYLLPAFLLAAVWYPIGNDGKTFCWPRNASELNRAPVHVVPWQIATVCDAKRDEDVWVGKGYDHTNGWYDSESGQTVHVEPPHGYRF